MPIGIFMWSGRHPMGLPKRRLDFVNPIRRALLVTSANAGLLVLANLGEKRALPHRYQIIVDRDLFDQGIELNIESDAFGMLNGSIISSASTSTPGTRIRMDTPIIHQIVDRGRQKIVVEPTLLVSPTPTPVTRVTIELEIAPFFRRSSAFTDDFRSSAST